MIIADMHNDTLPHCTARREPFFSCYNHSEKYPHLQFAAAFVGRGSTPAESRRREALRMADAFSSRAEEAVLIRNQKDLSRFLSGERRALLFSVEGGAGTDGSADVIPELYERGLRVFGLAWDDNELASSSRSTGTKDDYGLTKVGIGTLKKLETYGILPDVSHLSDRAVFDVFDHFAGTVLATHSNLRSLTPHPRNLTNEQAKEIARRGGVIGVNLYPPFLRGETATIADVLRHTDAMLSLVGEDAVGFGFDIDGVDSYPVGFSRTCSMHDRFADALLSAYPLPVVEKITGKNVIRVLSAALPKL